MFLSLRMPGRVFPEATNLVYKKITLFFFESIELMLYLIEKGLTQVDRIIQQKQIFLYNKSNNSLDIILLPNSILSKLWFQYNEFTISTVNTPMTLIHLRTHSP